MAKLRRKVMKKSPSKKPAAKKAQAKKQAAKKQVVKKPQAKKTAQRAKPIAQAKAKKPAVKKSPAKKPAVKKPAVKKPQAKKPAVKKPVAKKAVKTTKPKDQTKTLADKRKKASKVPGARETKGSGAKSGRAKAPVIENVNLKDVKTAFNKQQEECLAKVSTNKSLWRDGHCVVDNVFENMPKELVTEELCLAVVKKNGHMLLYVPKELKTDAVCRAAVEDTGFLGDVPEARRTEELCLIAARIDGDALRYVPGNIMTEAICIAAVKQDADALELVPNKLRDKVKAALADS